MKTMTGDPVPTSEEIEAWDKVGYEDDQEPVTTQSEILERARHQRDEAMLEIEKRKLRTKTPVFSYRNTIGHGSVAATSRVRMVLPRPLADLPPLFQEMLQEGYQSKNALNILLASTVNLIVCSAMHSNEDLIIDDEFLEDLSLKDPNIPEKHVVHSFRDRWGVMPKQLGEFIGSVFPVTVEYKGRTARIVVPEDDTLFSCMFHEVAGL